MHTKTNNEPCLARVVSGIDDELLNAAKEANLPRVEAALRAGANPNLTDSDLRTPAHYAAWRADTDCLVALIEAGANLNYPDKNSWTPLHLASGIRDPRPLHIILQQPSVAINAPDKWGCTPLHRATALAGKRSIPALIDAGADLFAETTHTWVGIPPGTTPLMVAVNRHRPGAAELLNDAINAQALQQKKPGSRKRPAL